ncbi:MAG: bifunctional (p)ppGpp synthetase/guanosine-3',5'-bis(diphosphate) 3'-pyrophosphohydrolase [Bacteroidetes bacterium]|nr:bifunctional (p)ppGpp synthetase/guanosine-3',5'-bis(diphosphate) 3'-pyrophosphohydrolase [Bacteroidota bacterium]
MSIHTIYQETLKYAAAKHVSADQKIPGTDLPYVVHLSNVAMEIMLAGFNTEKFDLAFAVQVALLHDTLEDTATNYPELAARFGVDVADAVQALTKNKDVPKDEQMHDCLKRIKMLRPEVWAVKLADRITNLQPAPLHWDHEKRKRYKEEAGMILQELKAGNSFLAKRLSEKISTYETK